MQNFDDIFREEEDRMYRETQAQLAKEKAAWDNLPQAEKDRINAERDARLDQMATAADQAEEDPDEDEEDEEEDPE